MKKQKLFKIGGSFFVISVLTAFIYFAHSYIVPEAKAGILTTPGALFITSITPDPATTTIVVSGTAAGGSDFDDDCPNPPSDNHSLVNEPLQTNAGYTIDGGSGGSFSLTQTQAAAGSHGTCRTYGSEPAGFHKAYQYSFSFTVNVASLPAGAHTIRLSTLDVATNGTIFVNGTFNKSANCTVLNCDPGVVLFANPNPVNSGSASTLTWTTSGSPDTCTASGAWSGSKNPSGGSEQTPALTNPPGSYVYTLTCTKAGYNNAIATVTVGVNPPGGSTGTGTGGGSGDFSLTCSPASYSVSPGSAASYTVTASPSGGFTDNLSLSVSGMPASATGSFSANPIAGGSGSSIFSVTDTGSVPAGTYTLTFTATGQTTGVSHAHSCNLTVASAAGNRTLTITKNGTGIGTVTSSPAGISCGSACIKSFSQGTTVTLNPVASPGSAFIGWSGSADCSDGSVTMTVNISCLATFNSIPATTYTLSLVKSGSGAGTVTSSPSGINCGAACSASYVSGTSVTLTATAAAGSSFAGWSGACSGTVSTCAVSMTGNKTVTATFALITCPAGTVILTPAAINVAATSTASAPAGWSGGTFATSNVAIAGVSGSVITGAEGGTASITGSGWTANNGALNCPLSATIITVKDFSITASANPVIIEPGQSSVLSIAVNSVQGGTMLVSVTPPSAATLPSGWSITPVTAAGSAGSAVSFTLNASGAAATTSFTLNFTGTYGGHSHAGSVLVTVATPAAITAELLINGSDDPEPVEAGSRVTVAWESKNAASCDVVSKNNVGSWSGLSESGTESAPLADNTRFTLTCTGAAGSVTDIVKAYVLPGDAVDVNNYNTSLDSGVACSQIRATWSPASGAAGYKVFRSPNATDSDPDSGIEIHDTGPVYLPSYEFFYTPAGGASYYYFVQAYRTKDDGTYYYSNRIVAGNFGPIAPASCSAQLSNSDKGTVSVTPAGTSTPLINSTESYCNGANPDPVTIAGLKTLKVNDVMTFKISICNNGTSAARSVTVTDRLVNLTPLGTYTGDRACAGPLTPIVTGSNGSYTLSFDFGGSLTVPEGGEYCSITYSARLTAPTGNTSTFLRSQNTAQIEGVDDVSGDAIHLVRKTALQLFSAGLITSPTLNEFAP